MEDACRTLNNLTIRLLCHGTRLKILITQQLFHVLAHPSLEQSRPSRFSKQHMSCTSELKGRIVYHCANKEYCKNESCYEQTDSPIITQTPTDRPDQRTLALHPQPDLVVRMENQMSSKSQLQFGAFVGVTRIECIQNLLIRN